MKFLSSLSKKHLQGKRVLVRVDFNIEEKNKAQSIRFQAAVATIAYILARGGRVVVVSHYGRPVPGKGVGSYSLKPFSTLLSRALKTPVEFIESHDQSYITHACKTSRRSVVLLENIRMSADEEKNTPSFGKFLASCADMYVNDAFSVSHRAHASVSAVTKYIPSYAGLHLEKELSILHDVMQKPKHPLVVIMGGAKVSDKIGVIKKFAKHADQFLIGGGIANALFHEKHIPIGESFYEESAETARIVRMKNIVLPIDTYISNKRILDIGPQSIALFVSHIARAKTIIWNGPVGLFEDARASKGTRALWNALVKNTRARVIVGGGETVASYKLISSKKTPSSHIFLSTGGGAMLDYLAGKKLPGIEALIKNKK